jgi:hypothetical protein
MFKKSTPEHKKNKLYNGNNITLFMYQMPTQNFYGKLLSDWTARLRDFIFRAGSRQQQKPKNDVFYAILAAGRSIRY